MPEATLLPLLLDNVEQCWTATLLPLLLDNDVAIRLGAVHALCTLLRAPDHVRKALYDRWAVVPPAPLLTSAPRAASTRQSHAAVTANSAAECSARAVLVRTEHTHRMLKWFGLALKSRRPTLLSGPTGCGKSALLAELARHHCASGRGLVTIHLDEQVDSRALLGTYVCSGSAGEFVWQPGVVTQAALRITEQLHGSLKSCVRPPSHV